MILVALSIAVLLSAPLLAALLAKSAMLASLLDSFVLVAVFGIVAFHVVPQSAGIAGLPAIAAVVVGVFLPIVLHRLDDTVLRGKHSTGRKVRDLVLLLAFCGGIFIHGMFDGTALAGGVATTALALAVLLHRLPVGLALWTVVRPKVGLARMLVVVVAYAGGTVTGALVGGAVLSGASLAVLAVVQAFVGGSILHIVAESAPFAPQRRAPLFVSGLKKPGALPLTSAAPKTPLPSRLAGVAGALLAGAVLYGVELLDGDHASPLGLDTGSTFTALAFASAPAVLLSFALVGVLTALYPDGVPAMLGRGPRLVDAVAGALAGLPHPLCSCSVAPLYETLVERGASPASARAFLVAAPELGVPAVLLGARLLGLPFTAARVAGAAFIAVLAGTSAAGKKVAAPRTPADVEREPFSSRLTRGMRHGVVDAVDHVGPWLLLGLAVCALVEPAVDERALAGLPHGVVTALLAVAALPLYLCAAGATPVAALLVHKGASIGAALAFLLVGPATSLPTLALVKRLHGPRVAATFAGLVVGGAVVVGIVVDALTSSAAALSSSPSSAGVFTGALDLHAAAAAGPSALQIGCAVVVTALLGASLLRQGVRGFLVQIMSPQHAHAGDHDHGPGCGHDHGPPLVAPPVARVALSFDPRGPA